MGIPPGCSSSTQLPKSTQIDRPIERKRVNLWLTGCSGDSSRTFTLPFSTKGQEAYGLRELQAPKIRQNLLHFRFNSGIFIAMKPPPSQRYIVSPLKCWASPMPMVPEAGNVGYACHRFNLQPGVCFVVKKDNTSVQEENDYHLGHITLFRHYSSKLEM